MNNNTQVPHNENDTKAPDRKPAIRVWEPSAATFPDNSLKLLKAQKDMRTLATHASYIQELVDKHLKNQGISEINIMPALTLYGTDIKPERHDSYHMVVGTDKKLHFSSEEGGVLPIIEGIEERTGLSGQVIGSWDKLEQHIAAAELNEKGKSKARGA